MTATQVNGVKVVASEPATTNLASADRPIYFKQVVKLLLEDGTEVYGCVHCDYTNEKKSSLRPHLGAHAQRKNKADQKSEVGRLAEDLANLPLEEILDWAQIGIDHVNKDDKPDPQVERQAKLIDKLMEEREEWKARAKLAESQISKAAAAFKQLTGG